VSTAIKAVETREMILPPGSRESVRFRARTGAAVYHVRAASSGSALEITARAHLYAALLADTCLDLIGSRECVIIDGPVFERTGVHSRAGELAADMKGWRIAAKTAWRKGR